MEHYAGMDVSLDTVSVCIVDGTGRVLREAKVASEPDVLVAWFGELGFVLERIGMEAGPLSQWLHKGMRENGLEVGSLETRHVRTAFKTMPVKTDRKDTRGIAQLMRWFRPVHCESLPAQETRALLTARKLVLNKRMEMGLRDFLRGFGLKIGPTNPRAFEARVRELVDGHRTLLAVAEALLMARTALIAELKGIESRLVGLVRGNKPVRLLMSAPGVGVIVALTYVSATDDP
jgi:transposase